MIKVRDLSKNYGSVEAVKSVSFDLNDGEVIGFLGANGAGKTTTLKMMTGYLVPSNGSITVNGMDIIDDTHAIQQQIGYLPELNPLYYEMRVLITQNFQLQFAILQVLILKKRFPGQLSSVVYEEWSIKISLIVQKVISSASGQQPR